MRLWILSLITSITCMVAPGYAENPFSDEIWDVLNYRRRLDRGDWLPFKMTFPEHYVVLPVEKGYATEGAKAALKYGFGKLNLPEIVSFTAVQNIRSRHVMEKVGMHHNEVDDFDQPKLAEGHPLKRHVLYRLKSDEWRKTICKT